MHRREFVRAAGFAFAGLALSSGFDLFAEAAPSAAWRTFEITTRVEVLQPVGRTRIWLPTPLTVETIYQKPLGNTLSSEAGSNRTVTDPDAANAIACFDFPEGAKPCRPNDLPRDDARLLGRSRAAARWCVGTSSVAAGDRTVPRADGARTH